MLKGLLGVWPELTDWLGKWSIQFSPYHGETLEGNEVSKVLNNLGDLELELPTKFHSFLYFLKDVSVVFESVFGYTLNPDYKATIINCEKSFSVLKHEFDITETPKFHILFNHVGQFIEKTGRPLGEFSEQVLENAHSAFSEVWEKYLVKDIKSTNYIVQYRRAVLSFNTHNI